MPEIKRHDALTIEYKGTEYTKIDNQWWELMEETLELIYNLDDELDEYLEELENSE
ncbi:MAG: hypothetical protein QM489_00715 [Candidatus Izemoplasma sp.]